MDEIATQAGLSKRTVYRYFKSKDDMLEAVIDHFLTNVSAEIDRILKTKNTSEEVFTDILETFYRVGRNFINPVVMQDMRQHYPHFWEKIDKFRMGRAQELITAFLKDNEKASIRGINPHIATAIVLATIQTVLNPEFIMSHDLTFQETAEQVIEFFKHGFLRGN